MVKPKVIVYSEMNETVLQELRNECTVTYCDRWDPNFAEKIRQELPDTVGIIGDGLRVDAELLDQAPNLKVVCNISVGYDNLDLDALSARNVLATNTPGVLTETVADLIFALILSTARRVPELDRYVKQGHWNSPNSPDLFATDVHGKTLGIIGMGRIGQSIARRGTFGFGMPVLYYNRSRNQEAEQEMGATYCSLDDLVQQADIVCLMTPLTQETRGLMGEREFSLMKKEAIFINGSRGPTVDEQALVRALQNKTIASAGLDVFVQEPVDPRNPLLQMDNVVTLPHVGADTHQNRLRMDQLAAQNLLQAVQGKRPPSLLNDDKTL